MRARRSALVGALVGAPFRAPFRASLGASLAASFRTSFAASLAACVAALSGCVASPALPQLDPGLANLQLASIHPAVVVPGTALDLLGASFVDHDAGLPLLRVDATFAPTSGPPRDLTAELPLVFVDATHYRFASNAYALLGGAPGRLTGAATLAVDSAIDQTRHAALPIPIDLTLVAALTPALDGVVGGAIRINDGLAVRGGGFLLGGAEGETRAVVSGCYLLDGHAPPCADRGTPVQDVEVAGHPAAPWDRAHLVFPFSPALAGIHPGTFSGRVRLRNVPKKGAATLSAATLPLDATVQPSVVTQFSPSAASLGQYVDVTGAGFVGGGAPGLVTLLHLVGGFTPDGSSAAIAVDLQLLPRFVAGDHLRYVVDEADELGHRVNLRQTAGKFVGTALPVLRLGEEEEVGTGAPVSLTLAHVKQVVVVSFADSYVDSLYRYGLRAADAAVRDRIFTVAARDYAGVNVEWRRSTPTDFALYSEVDVLGPDPNNLDLLGYDNTPGKDVGNSRLFDRIGGVNATTQDDGFPGYGGIFAEQFLGFSQHPPSSVSRLPFDTTRFDAIFDPLRPDRGGQPATPPEIALVPPLADGVACPSTQRPMQVACAVFVLGNLIGTTLTHEVGHSLGLANPYGDGFHDVGDLPNRLMEAGSDRPFEERAEIGGQGPGRFCDSEYQYLRAVLPLPGAVDPYPSRPSCK